MSFGEFLRQLRQQKNLTQKELASLLFVSDSAISKWEKDVARPDISLLPRLSEILGVSEHELITASVDNKAREERTQAKRWRVLTFSWNLFFLIAYGVALIPCFICNLAIDGTLSWFWIVLSALLLSATFTNFPRYVKRHRLLLLPLSSYFALVLLLTVCCIYSGGSWIMIPAVAVLLALVIVFLPIYIAKFEIFSKIRRFGDFASVFVDFLLINLLLVTIDIYCVANGFSESHWYFGVALPIVAVIYLCLTILMSVRFLKINKFLKSAIILSLSAAFLYLPPLFITPKSPSALKEIGEMNIFRADFSRWNPDANLENNVHLIIFLTAIFLAAVFCVIGLIRHIRRAHLK